MNFINFTTFALALTLIFTFPLVFSPLYYSLDIFQTWKSIGSNVVNKSSVLFIAKVNDNSQKETLKKNAVNNDIKIKTGQNLDPPIPFKATTKVESKTANPFESARALARKMYENGKIDQAFKTLEPFCNSGIAQACHSLAYIEDKRNNNSGYEKYEKLACEKKHPDACTSLGFFEESKKNNKAMMDYFVKGCNLHQTVACNKLGYFREGAGKINEAIKFYEKSLKLGDDGYSTYRLASISLSNNSLTSAEKFAQDSCKKNFGDGCYTLGTISERLSKNIEAKKAFEKGCKLESKESCNKL